jgi:hypothetical protein
LGSCETQERTTTMVVVIVSMLQQVLFRVDEIQRSLSLPAIYEITFYIGRINSIGYCLIIRTSSRQSAERAERNAGNDPSNKSANSLLVFSVISTRVNPGQIRLSEDDQRSGWPLARSVMGPTYLFRTTPISNLFAVCVPPSSICCDLLALRLLLQGINVYHILSCNIA